MKSYEVTLEYTYIIKTDNVEQVMKDYEFPNFLSADAEFIDGKSDWKEVEVSA